MKLNCLWFKKQNKLIFISNYNFGSKYTNFSSLEKKIDILLTKQKINELALSTSMVVKSPVKLDTPWSHNSIFMPNTIMRDNYSSIYSKNFHLNYLFDINKNSTHVLHKSITHSKAIKTNFLYNDNFYRENIVNEYDYAIEKGLKTKEIFGNIIYSNNEIENFEFENLRIGHAELTLRSEIEKIEQDENIFEKTNFLRKSVINLTRNPVLEIIHNDETIDSIHSTIAVASLESYFSEDKNSLIVLNTELGKKLLPSKYAMDNYIYNKTFNNRNEIQDYYRIIKKLNSSENFAKVLKEKIDFFLLSNLEKNEFLWYEKNKDVIVSSILLKNKEQINNEIYNHLKKCEVMEKYTVSLGNRYVTEIDIGISSIDN